MIAHNHRAARTLIREHFAGRGAAREYAELQVQLETCESCRRHYELHLAAEQLDPEALGPKERLRRCVGKTRRPFRLRILLPTLVTAAAAALVTLALVPKQEPAEFVARGSVPDELSIHLSVFRVVSGQAPLPVNEEMAADDELAFAYENPTGKTRLLVFGVDDQQNVYWYYPAWEDPSDNPAAVPIERGAMAVELKEAVSHPIEGKWLRLFAIFSDRTWRVREIEALLPAKAYALERLPSLGGMQTSHLLRVTRGKSQP